MSYNEYNKNHCEVIEQFYLNFKNELMIDKMVGNIEQFILNVGRDNFKNFNKWIIDYYNKYTTPEERKKLNDNSSVEYKIIIAEGMEIIQKMISCKSYINE